MSKSKHDMLSGPITKGILAMMLPIMIMNVTQALFSLVDMTVLGNFAASPEAGDKAVGAVGACSFIIVLITGLLIGISVGANVIVAKYVGAGDIRRAEKAAGASILFAFVGGLALLVVGVVFARVFLVWTNCDEKLLFDATTYFRLYFLGVPFLLIYNFAAAVLRALGDTKRPMYILIIGSVSKIIFNFVFIAFFNMDVLGVAIATIIFDIIVGSLCFAALFDKTLAIGFKLSDCRFYGSELKEMLKVGIPAGIQQALYCFANVIILTAVNVLGENATTGLTVANQFDNILYQIALATSFAATPYMAQNIGAGNFTRVKKAFFSSILITVAFGATLGALSAYFSPELSSLMTSTPAVIEYSCQKMIIVSSTYFICGINEVLAGALRGVGKPIVPTVTAMIFLCALRFIWVWFVFPYCPDNLTYLYLVWPIGWTLSIIVHLIIYIPTMKKLEKSQA